LANRPAAISAVLVAVSFAAGKVLVMARRTRMLDHRPIAAITLTLALLLSATRASAFDDSKYPDLKGQWDRLGPPSWAPAGDPPYTPEYKAVFEAALADMANGGSGGVISQDCFPQGVPMMMNIYDPMEIAITADITYILISHVNDSYRRIYTDGKGWPGEDHFLPTYAGYSVGKWVDEDGDGKYDVLEIETRHFLSPRVFDARGLPLHKDGQSVVNERIFLDKADKNILYDEITVHDNSLTRPWSVTKKMKRIARDRPLWRTAVCAEGNTRVKIEGENYFLSADGKLMPTRKDQPPPDLQYFTRK
jgi:hypothetical protein